MSKLRDLWDGFLGILAVLGAILAWLIYEGLSWAISIAFFGLIIFGGIKLCSDDNDEKEYNKLINAAYKYMDDYELTKAIEKCNEAIELTDDNSEAYFLKSLVYINKGNNDKALFNINKAIELDDTKNKYFLVRGRVMFLKEDYRYAIEDFNYFISKNPEEYAGYSWRSIAKLGMQDYESALIDINNAIKISQGSADLIYSRGIIYFRWGKLDKACKDWKDALRKGYHNAQYEIDRYCYGDD
jgi:tetratricopeptide (TPR) repeat protein